MNAPKYKIKGYTPQMNFASPVYIKNGQVEFRNGAYSVSIDPAAGTMTCTTPHGQTTDKITKNTSEAVCEGGMGVVKSDTCTVIITAKKGQG